VLLLLLLLQHQRCSCDQFVRFVAAVEAIHCSIVLHYSQIRSCLTNGLYAQLYASCHAWLLLLLLLLQALLLLSWILTRWLQCARRCQ
jgi:hypothetical protein